MIKFDPGSIRRIRLARSLTLEQFALSLCGMVTVSKQLVQQWEGGAQVPTVSSLLKIVNAHNIPFDAFFLEEAEEKHGSGRHSL